MYYLWYLQNEVDWKTTVVWKGIHKFSRPTRARFRTDSSDLICPEVDRRSGSLLNITNWISQEHTRTIFVSSLLSSVSRKKKFKLKLYTNTAPFVKNGV